jgi:hypothetical protein
MAGRTVNRNSEPKKINMKRFFFILAFIASTSMIASAQTEPKKKVETDNGKTKVKPKTTLGDKAHNVIHPHKKRSHGVEVKHKKD